MADETTLVATWITESLSGAVYEGIAPIDAVEPYTVFAFVSTPDVITHNGQIVFTRCDVDVKHVCSGGSYAPLTPLAEEAKTALHLKANVAVAGGSIVSSRRIAPIRFTENNGGKVYRHLGGTYRIESRGE